MWQISCTISSVRITISRVLRFVDCCYRNIAEHCIRTRLVLGGRLCPSQGFMNVQGCGSSFVASHILYGVEDIMSNIWWVLFSIIAYVGGLYIMLRTTPMLLARSYDEGMFMAIAAGDILGAILAFGGIVVIYAAFDGGIVVKIVGILLLIGVLLITGRLALFSLRPRYVQGTNKLSRVITGIYCLCLVVASLYYMVQMFTS
jgi:hypothetical protein